MAEIAYSGVQILHGGGVGERERERERGASTTIVKMAHTLLADHSCHCHTSASIPSYAIQTIYLYDIPGARLARHGLSCLDLVGYQYSPLSW